MKVKLKKNAFTQKYTTINAQKEKILTSKEIRIYQDVENIDYLSYMQTLTKKSFKFWPKQ